MLSAAQAWACLPGAPADGQPLPAWARMLAGPLPQTTAQMLQLDALHRSGDHIEPILRGKLRWVAADVNRSLYAKAAAAADLRRAGLNAAELAVLPGVSESLSEGERSALTFGRKLTADAVSVTDDEVKRLIELHGERRVVAMVALLAQASFQDRLLLPLDPPIEPDGPPPPVAAKFPHTRTRAGPTPQPPAGVAALKGNGTNRTARDLEWPPRSYDDLQKGLEQQRQRPARIRVPEWHEVAARITPDSWAVRWPRVLWMRVCCAHQPELSDAWFDCVDAFRQETKQDRLLQQDIFWVVTRAIECFY
jgi:alkylhydroperoxidase family enzyme